MTMFHEIGKLGLTNKHLVGWVRAAPALPAYLDCSELKKHMDEMTDQIIKSFGIPPEVVSGNVGDGREPIQYKALGDTAVRPGHQLIAVRDAEIKSSDPLTVFIRHDGEKYVFDWGGRRRSDLRRRLILLLYLLTDRLNLPQRCKPDGTLEDDPDFEMVPVPCPDGKPGCLVAHFERRKKVKPFVAVREDGKLINKGISIRVDQGEVYAEPQSADPPADEPAKAETWRDRAPLL